MNKFKYTFCGGDNDEFNTENEVTGYFETECDIEFVDNRINDLSESIWRSMASKGFTETADDLEWAEYFDTCTYVLEVAGEYEFRSDVDPLLLGKAFN